MKKSISLLLIMCMVLAGCGKSSKDTGSEDIVLADNQSLKYGQVTKINGNEITIALANEVSASEMQSQRGNKNNGSQSPSATGDVNATGSAASSSSAPQGGTAPSGDSTQSGDRASGDASGGGTPPDISSGGGPGEMPGSDSSSNSTGSSSGTSTQDGSSSGKQNKSDKNASSTDDSGKSKVMYQLTGEEETLTIPVGTAVTTTLGTTTTFSRIAVDDTLKLVMQKNDAGEEVIVGVWIVA